ncbi:MAG: glycosyltransferase 87 family protein [Thermoleophilia bacterium]
MAASSASSSRPAKPAATAAALVLGLLLLIASWAALHHWFFDDAQIVDTRIYLSYGNRIADGAVPYRDFRVEYPPGALPVFAAPAIRHAPSTFESYRRLFETLMFVAAGLGLIAVAVALRGLRAGRAQIFGALAFAGVAPLLLGSVVLSRFDLWPAAICAGAVAALVCGRPRLGLALLGLGVATKLWPGVVVPFALVYIWRREGRRQAIVAGSWFAGVLTAWVLPFLIVSPSGLWHSISGQLTRPLQIESLGSSFLLVAHQFGLDITMRSSHGSQNLAGGGAYAIGVAQTVIQLAVLAALFAGFLRLRKPASDDLVRYAAAAVVAFVALGKVLSPQFLIWLVPLVPLVRGRRGLVATALLGCAAVLTQIWFPYRYWDLALGFDPASSWLVFVRDLVLVGLLCVLAWPAGDAGSTTTAAWWRTPAKRDLSLSAGVSTKRNEAADTA